MFRQGLYRGGGSLRLLCRSLGSTAVAGQAQEAEEKEMQVDCLGKTWLSVGFGLVVAAASVGGDRNPATKKQEETSGGWEAGAA